MIASIWIASLILTAALAQWAGHRYRPCYHDDTQDAYDEGISYERGWWRQHGHGAHCDMPVPDNASQRRPVDGPDYLDMRELRPARSDDWHDDLITAGVEQHLEEADAVLKPRPMTDTTELWIWEHLEQPMTDWLKDKGLAA